MYYGLINSMNRILPPNSLWINLKAYYTADNTPNDALGVHNGTLINGATYATGKINNGFNFDGINDYVNIATSFGQSFSAPTSAHTYSAWIYPTNITDQYNFIINNGTAQIGTAMSLNTDKISFFYKGGNTSVSSNVTIPINTWTLVTVVYNGANSVSFYKNGVFDVSKTASWTEAVGTPTTNIGSFVKTTHYFNGTIDEVGAWSRALTATEVTELYNSGSGKQYTL